MKRVPLVNFTLFPEGPNDPGCPIAPVLPYVKNKLATGSSYQHNRSVIRGDNFTSEKALKV